ncbi:DUF397 domain-containing protein [Actinoplanes couchii]|uniref:DUF397 domain-containing protein n=1 Tax=Actinoplanes couchii TaxID=403638 RepID=A0ABQ3XII6_9ACTN|nr:DUF397 domain-containing protein [Actinoplanes couchii]MDR6323846.1 hypothetical protein [Actinoplanes couchii]GID58316.1 hypothetical protein Aco03nite_067200 [Actinoplanes couchii]
MIKPTEETHWRRSRRCSTGTCVEVARVAERVLVRDSKVSDGAILAFTRKEWDSFLAGVKDGEFRSV